MIAFFSFSFFIFIFIFKKRMNLFVIGIWFVQWANLVLVYIMFRKVNSSPRMGFQRHHSHMGGKEMLGSMQLGSQGEGSLVHPQMP
jgi:hypothetical protein